jgi:hypothetical protein
MLRILIIAILNCRRCMILIVLSFHKLWVQCKRQDRLFLPNPGQVCFICLLSNHPLLYPSLSICVFAVHHRSAVYWSSYTVPSWILSVPSILWRFSPIIRVIWCWPSAPRLLLAVSVPYRKPQNVQHIVLHLIMILCWIAFDLLSLFQKLQDTSSKPMLYVIQWHCR